MTEASTDTMAAITTARRRPSAQAEFVWIGAASVVVFLALWEIVARLGLIPNDAIPPVSEISSALYGDLQTPAFWASLWATTSAWLVGMAIVIVVAVPVGVALGSSRWAFASTFLTIQFFRSIPSIAALPVLILITGVGFTLTLVLVVLTALWPLLIQSVHGAREVDPVARATARVYGVKPVGIFFRVSLPSALPFILTGLRLSATIGLIIAVASSLVAGGEGLGALIANASRNSQYPLMYGRIIVAGILGLIVTIVFTRLEATALAWQPSRQGGR